MNKDFFEAIRLLESEYGINAEDILEKIKNAIAVSIRRDRGTSENAIVDIDLEKGRFIVAVRKKVVENPVNPNTEISLADAQKLSKRLVVGDTVDIKLDPKRFARQAAQAAKSVIRSGIRDVEKAQIIEEFQSKAHEIVTATVQRIDPRTGAAIVEIGKTEVHLPLKEQIDGEVLKEGDHIKVYVVDVKTTDKDPRPMISRTHPGIIKRLFEIEVPEIFEGIVEIKALSREAGSRTKIAVASRDENVDPIGACIGPRGTRINKIIEEINGEKIDIIKYSEDPIEFISQALSPAAVSSASIVSELDKTCRVYVPSDQLSLAIGNKGQNVRLAAKLTGWKIDIHPDDTAANNDLQQ